MPSPHEGESHDEFIERCMEDGEAMHDFPDEKQRFAFCESQWSNRGRGEMGVKLERRWMPLDNVEVRQDDDGTIHFSGHAAVFDSLTDLGPFREKVAPGAFKRTIQEAIRRDPDIVFLFNHDADTLMASYHNQTLRLREDERGLATEADLDSSDWDVQRIYPKMRRGDLKKMSFAFDIPDRQSGQVWDQEPEDGGKPIRTLREVRLYDVSVVTHPAYKSTDAQIKRCVEEEWERRQQELVEDDPETVMNEAVADNVPNEPDSPEARESDPGVQSGDSESPPETDESSRDKHSLATVWALRKARIELIDEMLRPGA